MQHAVRTYWGSLRTPDRPCLCWHRRRPNDPMALSLRVRQRKGRNRQELDSGSHAIMRLQAGRSQRCCAGWISAAGQIWVRNQIARFDSIAALYDLDQHPTALQQSTELRLPHLWRPRYSCLRRVEPEFRGVLPRHEPDLGTRSDDRPHQYRRAIFARKLPLGADVRAVENAALAWPQTRRWQPQQAVSQEPGAA